MKAAHTIQTLWDHAGLGLPDSALEHLSGAEDAVDTLRNIADLLNGLGGLLGADAEPAAGLVQEGGRLAGLFFGLASVVAVQAELVAVAGDAAAILRQRRASGGI